MMFDQIYKRAAILGVIFGLATGGAAIAQNIANPVLKTVYESMPMSQQCENPSFETGFSAWTRFFGLTSSGFASGLRPPTIVPATTCTENAYGQSCNRLEVGGVDVNVSVLPRTAIGNAVRLGGQILPTSDGFGADGIGRRFVVQAGNEIYKFRYAAVMERAHDSHPNFGGQEPFFQAIAIDPTTGAVIDRVLQPASGYNFNVFPSEENPSNRYIPWTCAQLDLTGYTGQEVVVYFISGDCGQSGHAAYAYVDDTCADCEVPAEPTAEVTLDLAPAQCTKPDQNVAVSGNFEISDEYFDLYGATNVNVSLDVVQSNSTIHTVPTGTMTGTTYSFDLDPSVLPQDSCFDLVVTLTFDTVTPTGLVKTITIVTAADGRVEGQDNDLCTGGDTCLPNCAPFTQEEAICNITTGTYEISIANSLSGSFDPNDITVTTTTPGVTITQDPFDPLKLLVTGATPGQVIPISTSAVATGAGAGTGLDLCCNGELEITIPEGEFCEIMDDETDNGSSEVVDVSIEKTWHDVMPSHAEAGTVPHGFEIIVDLDAGQLQAGDIVTVSDPLSGQVGVTSFGTPIAPAPWVCTESSGAWECTYVVPQSGAILPATITWPSIIDGNNFVKNCADVTLDRGNMSVAETSMANNTSCWSINEPTEGGETDLTITKTCSPMPINGETTIPCQITVTGTGPAGGGFIIGDEYINPNFNGDTNTQIGQITGPSEWACESAPYGNGSWPGCQISSADFAAAGGTATFTTNVTVSPDEMGAGVQNCAIVGVVDLELDRSCVDITANNPVSCVPTPEIPDDGIDNDCDGITDENLSNRSATPDTANLSLVKTSLGACDVNRQSQTYTCDFALIVENAGPDAYTGPLSIQDIFGSPTPRGVSNVSGDGWSCLTGRNGDEISCLAPSMSLASGEDMTVEMTLTLPGRPNGGAFENCAALALPDDQLLRNKIVQSLLNDMGIDVGTVDGVVGPNTRAGILQLEQQENWPQTGEVSVALLAALGLNATSGQTCVTVALSPMPAPPLVCDPSTTVLIDGSCECRFSRMMQTNPSSCTCISGTQLQAGQGCVRPQRQTSTPSTPRPTVDTPNCPAGSTYNAARRACIAPAPAPQRCRLPNQTLVNGECTCNPGFVRAGFHCNRPSTDSDSQGPIP